MVNVFVTGGHGFLGKHLVRKLIEMDLNVTAPKSSEVDLRNASNLGKYDKTTFDTIFHLAAWTQAGNFAAKYPGQQWINNQLINTNMLTWWRERNPKAYFISVGTSCSYSKDSSHEESQYLDGLPFEDLLTYGSTKRMLYIGQQSFEKEFKMKSLVAVPSTLYGTGYEVSNRQPHFIFDLIKKSLDFKYYGKPIVIWGNGSQRRELVYVNDFVDALVYLTQIRYSGLINIASGVEQEILYFLDIIKSVCGVDNAKVSFDLTAHVGVLSKQLNIDKLKRAMPEYKTSSFLRTLKETVSDIEVRYYKSD